MVIARLMPVSRTCHLLECWIKHRKLFGAIIKRERLAERPRGDQDYRIEQTLFYNRVETLSTWLGILNKHYLNSQLNKFFRMTTFKKCLNKGKDQI